MARGYVSLQYPSCTVRSHALDIIRIPDTNPTKGDVALVKASNGTVLRKVADDPEWQKIREEGDRRRQEAAAIRPKKQGPSRKRPRMEMTSNHNNQDGLSELPIPDLPMVPHDELRPVPERQAMNFDKAISHEEPHRPSGPSMPAPRLPSQQHEVSHLIFCTSPLDIFSLDFQCAPSVSPPKNPQRAPLLPPTHDLRRAPSIPASQDRRRAPSIPPPGWYQYPPQPGPSRPHQHV